MNSPRVAIVTGAGSESGIGFASASALATAGLRLVIASTTARIEDRAATLRAAGAEVATFIGDLTSSALADALVAVALDAYGQVDVLVNNAGLTSVSDPEVPAPIDRTDDQTWHATIARNLDTMFFMTRAVVPLMRAAGYGRIVNVASVSGPVVAYPGDAAYHAAKAGALGLTRSVALDTARDGITVNAVAPGWIGTDAASEAELAYGRATPVGRSGTAAEVAGLVAYLTGPSAGYLTGQLIVVDGGNSIVEAHTGG
ncbi:SDR family NAD(P)-dependent oxidoreductase [Jatrophihabitans sp.]|uniref:SDR family NAD(P)-dependent oxidoreductase n=1 Tax=Jatrophihabitans sp. TaxID=1932789 RepID=UPI0030C67629|nr:fabG 1 [Jatrophihabitans sp.]